MINNYSKRLVVSGLMLALGIVLPYFTAHGFGMSGNVLLPMHIPVFLCGFLCGPVFGALCGLLLPVLNSFLTGMPALYPMAVIMTCELLVYGFCCGELYRFFKFSQRWYVIAIVLVLSMVMGRISYGIVCWILLLGGANLGKISVISAVVTGIPGIVIQLILIPAIVFKIRKNISLPINAIDEAKRLILSGEASCVVVKDGRIVEKSSPMGISYILDLYDKGVLKDAFVADKIIGKAASMIFTLGGVSGCFGETVSEGAVKWLEEHNVDVSYKNISKYIINRKGDGMCPMEQTVLEIFDEEEAVAALKSKVKELSKK